MRLYILYVSIAVTLFSCSSGVNNISDNKAQITETNKKSSQAVTKNTSSANTPGTISPNSSGKECDEQKPCCWNKRMMLW